MLSRLASVTALAALLAGCPDPKAAEKCNDLCAALCDNLLETCPGDMGDMTTDACVAELQAETYSCDDILDVTDYYDACLDEIEASDECLPYEGLPEVCEGVLVYAE